MLGPRSMSRVLQRGAARATTSAKLASAPAPSTRAPSRRCSADPSATPRAARPARARAATTFTSSPARGGQRLSPGGGGGGFGRDGAAPGHDGATDTNAEQEHEQHQREGVGGAPNDHHQHAGPGNFVE